MNMEILRQAQEKTVDRVVDALNRGEVVCVPTDTVYGLVGDFENSDAAQRIYALKDRSEEKPLPMFVSDIRMAKRYAEISEKQERFLEKVWGRCDAKLTRMHANDANVILGKVTAVLKTRNQKNKKSKKQTTIGIRVPDHALLQQILKKMDRALVQSSANVSDKPPATTVEEAKAYFGDQDILFADGGVCDSEASTVVDLTEEEPKVLREGAVSESDIVSMYRDGDISS